MADSIREKVISNVVSVLKGVTIPAGYDVTLQNVFRTPQSPFESVDFPFAVVFESSEAKSDGNPAQFTQGRLRVDIAVWMNRVDDFSQEINKAIASVCKALYLDQTRGGNAIDTTVVDNEVYVSEPAMPLGGFSIGVEILYRHRLGDPYTK